MFAEPVLADVASPCDPAALLTVATPGVSELQVALEVTSCVEWSENVPVAVNCSVVPLAMLGLDGVTAIDTTTADVTVSFVDPEVEFRLALMFAEPVPTEVARPCDPAALLTVATPGVSELQVTEAVKS